MTNRAILPLALTVLTIAVPACDLEIEPAQSEHAIIHGDAVDGDGFGTVIGIMTNAGTICTGTLISPTVVLTAAHCVEPDLLKQSVQAAGGTPPDTITYQVSFSRNLRDVEAGDMIDAASVEWHADFLSDLNVLFEQGVTQWNDVALVYLADPVEDHPVQLLAPTDVVEAIGDEMLAVAGYGMTDDADPMSAGSLHSGRSGMDELGTFEILAGEGDSQQACRGDSGGPIFADDSDTYQIGIASRLNATPDLSGEVPACNTGLLYTRVDAYLAWIQSKVPDLGQATEPCAASDPSPTCDGATGSPDAGVGSADAGTSPSDGDDSGGCGCTVGGTTAPIPAAFFLFVACSLFLVLLRRPR